MLTIAPEALEMIQQLGGPVFLELPKTITNCCFDFQECPAVRSGVPRNPGDYKEILVQDVTVFVPVRLPDIPLVIRLRSILGIRNLIVDGWRYF